MGQVRKKHPRMDCIDHIECILSESCTLEHEVNRLLKSIIKNGHEPVYIVGTPSLAGNNPMKGTVIAVGLTDGIQVVAALDNRDGSTVISSFYPVGKPLDSVQPRCGICSFAETECSLEAYATMTDEPLTFSVANYPDVRSRDEYKNVRSIRFHIVGFCYTCQKIDKNMPIQTQTLDLNKSDWYGTLPQEKRSAIDSDWNVGEDQKVTLDVTSVKLFYQQNERFPDEFIFASPVYDIDEIKVHGLPMYRIKIMTSEALSDGEEDRFITVYVKRMLFPDGLQKGDFVKGVGWLQGIFCDSNDRSSDCHHRSVFH